VQGMPQEQRSLHRKDRRRHSRLLPACLAMLAASSRSRVLSGQRSFTFSPQLPPLALAGRTPIPAVAIVGTAPCARHRLACAAFPEANVAIASATALPALIGAPVTAAAATVALLLVSGGKFVSLGLSGTAALYIIISFTEYIYHRYVQHLDLNRVGLYKWMRQTLGAPTLLGDFHVLHHRETLNSMLLDPVPVEEWPDVTVHRGTAATWLSFVKMTCCIMLPAHPLLCALGWSAPFAALAVVMATLLHLMAYNSLHPQMHGLPNVSFEQGPPSLGFGFQESAVAGLLRRYHIVHHQTYAKKNFNVCCPLVDHLLGTFATKGSVA